jgi:Ca2+-binding EF-hand superfamily protein
MTTSESFTMRMITMTLTPWVVTKVALVALSLSASAHANPQRAQVQANFQAADVDKNGQLSLTEFTTFINLNADHNVGQASSIRRFGMYTKAFKRADANGDGIVTKEEIAAQAEK